MSGRATPRFAQKCVLITGAASGMGACQARLFAGEGANIVVADLLDEDGMNVVRAICNDGGNAEFVHLDVTRESDWAEALASAVRGFGAVDILVNNAGISGGIALDLLSTDAYDRLMDVNAKGVFLGMKHAIPQMGERGGGSIVNISSIAGFVGLEGIHMGYGGSKGAVRALTKSAAVQYAADGIRVNSVHPGAMPPMKTAPPEVRAAPADKWLERIPMRRRGRLEEVAYAVLFLASDEASYITGTEIVVDGGYLAL